MVFRSSPNCPPFFPQRGHDFEIRFSDLNLLSLSCAFSHSNSYGLAHMQFWVRQKYFKNELNFNNFTLEHVVRNKIIIFAPRFLPFLGIVFLVLKVCVYFSWKFACANFHTFYHWILKNLLWLCFVILTFGKFPTHIVFA